MRLADARAAEQQDRRQFDVVLRVDAQRELAADVLQDLAEIGQFLEQRLHLGQAGGLDREALAAQAQHLLVERAQRLVGGLRQVLQGFFDRRGVVDILESGDRDRRRGDGQRDV